MPLPSITDAPEAPRQPVVDPSSPQDNGSVRTLPPAIEQALYREAMLIARRVDREAGDNSSYHQVHNSAVMAARLARRFETIPPEAN